MKSIYSDDQWKQWILDYRNSSLSLKSRDPSQRANGFMTVAGGIVITFAKEILNIIVG